MGNGVGGLCPPAPPQVLGPAFSDGFAVLHAPSQKKIVVGRTLGAPKNGNPVLQAKALNSPNGGGPHITPRLLGRISRFLCPGWYCTGLLGPNNPRNNPGYRLPVSLGVPVKSACEWRDGAGVCGVVRAIGHATRTSGVGQEACNTEH